MCNMKKIYWKYILELVLSLAIFFLGIIVVFFVFGGSVESIISYSCGFSCTAIILMANREDR